MEYVIVGDAHNLMIPQSERLRSGLTRLKGVRLVHTLRKGETLGPDDFNDLALLRLDFVAGLEVDDQGEPARLQGVHLLPTGRDGDNLAHLGPFPFGRSVHDIDFPALIDSLEEEFSKAQRVLRVHAGRERALLVSVSSLPKTEVQDRLDELEELAESCGLEPAGRVIQTRRSGERSPTLLGKGKLSEIVIRALQTGAELLVFDQDLSPSQARALSGTTELKIIDRTQLILDIFAQRARSREGKIQVELAQLKYMLPHLVTKNTAMSRLTGGIGGRGPGETKLEINRRRARERITSLQRELDLVRKQRKTQRKMRQRKDMPTVAIIGYTNAGKSTLLNTLTKSDIFVQNRLFATLDPTSRRLKFPKDREIIITDTVGFIQDLPRDLVEAFRATLEQLEEAHLLLHVVDVSNPHFEQHIQAVNKILHDLDLDFIPVLTVFNKEDLAPPELVAERCFKHHALSISAKDEATLAPLVAEIERRLWPDEESIRMSHSGEGLEAPVG